jgi:hypothetical protein
MHNGRKYRLPTSLALRDNRQVRGQSGASEPGVPGMTLTPAIEWITRSTAEACGCGVAWSAHRDIPRHERPNLGALTNMLEKSEPQLDHYVGPAPVLLDSGEVQVGKTRPYTPRRASASLHEAIVKARVS